MAALKPKDESEAADIVRMAAAEGRTLEILGRGSKRSFGRPVAADAVADVSALAGIRAFEPHELVLTCGAATPVAELAEALAKEGQRFAFDPADWGALLGAQAGIATIGGVISANACGPGRVAGGAVRDHLLGYRAVNGYGDAYKAGGRVVKNVTGFDLPKLVCGAMGTLSLLTEVTLRTVPAPPIQCVATIPDVAPAEGLAALRRVRAAPVGATGLAYLPAAALERIGEPEQGRGAALIRLDGSRDTLEEKLAHLRGLLGSLELRVSGDDKGIRAFAAIGDGRAFAGTPFDVWRLHVPPSQAAAAAAEIAAPLWLADWAGALLWAGAAPGDASAPARLAGIAGKHGGHATLLRASEERRAACDAFPREEPERAALTRAVKAAFDPLGIFNPGRMYDGV